MPAVAGRAVRWRVATERRSRATVLGPPRQEATGEKERVEGAFRSDSGEARAVAVAGADRVVSIKTVLVRRVAVFCSSRRWTPSERAVGVDGQTRDHQRDHAATRSRQTDISVPDAAGKVDPND